MYEDKLEVRYKLDSSRDAEVLRSSVRNVANGQLHTVTIRRLTDSVSVQVKTPHQFMKLLQVCNLAKYKEIQLAQRHRYCFR